MRAILAILLVAALAACGPMPAPAPASAPADSISLERTPCFGGCAAYRVSLARDGTVRFQSGNPGDTTTATDRIDPAAFDALAREARRIGFWCSPT
jgi:streptogramin lyase